MIFAPVISTCSKADSNSSGVASRTLKGLRRAAAYWTAPSELDRMAATHTGRVMNQWQQDFEMY
ncbi:MAG: hypothetical protein ACLPTZ_27115, partial [Beijerinckiaceae bacterium]